MRLWHYKLLPCLDDFHIVAQWRELLAIKGAIDKNGTPNHRLVNKVLDFSILEFKQYTFKVAEEMQRRNIRFMASRLGEVMVWECDHFAKRNTKTLYEGWHNHRYLTQCYYNLEEKHDCGIISDDAWKKIDELCTMEMSHE